MLTSERDTLRTASQDFTHRADPSLLPEWMDEPCDYVAFRDCVRDIAATTRLTRAYGPILRFLEAALASRPNDGGPTPPQDPHGVSVLDVGSGGGDVLRRLAAWCSRHRVSVRLTGVDLNPHATRAAVELSAGSPFHGVIHWLTGDVFTHPDTQSPDLVISSLVTHHMRDDEVVRFLRWMEEHARRGWFISDLRRSETSYRLFGPLARLMRWHPFVQHDGLVSIRRAFREPDWHRLLDEAGIPRGAVRLHSGGLGRLCLARLR